MSVDALRREKRSLTLACIVALVSSSGCATNLLTPARDMSHPTDAVPDPGAKPATSKWQGPWMKDGVGSGLRATLYYGPWQCNQRWMESCERECAAKGYALKGCMWLVDIKYDWQAPVMPIKAGSRYALWHCCCDSASLSPSENEALRKLWNGQRKTLRQKWAGIFGEWPTTEGINWPGHHMDDLAHGGDPTDLGNIVPAPQDVHEVFNLQYPACYEGSAPWNTVGPDLPYTDQ